MKFRERVAVTSFLFVALMATVQAQTLVPRFQAQALLPGAVAKTNTDLNVCGLGAGCPPGMGGWAKSINIYSDAMESPRDFMWKTDAPAATQGRWEIAAQPFPDSASQSVAVLASGDAGSPGIGRFSILLKNLPSRPTSTLTPTPTPTPSHGIGQKNPASLVKLPPRYYVRVIPMAGGRPAGTPSNSVILDLHPSKQAPTNPVITLQPADTYTLEILGFEPVRPASLPWGCVVMSQGDWGKLKKTTLGALHEIYPDPTGVGVSVCAKTYKGIGEPAWYESLWDFASSATDWAASTYAKIKENAVKFVAGAINALPGNLCNSDCEKGLMAGLNAGLVALGMPPELPSLDELSGQGMNYLVDLTLSQAGIECDQACQDAIRGGIEQMTREAGQSTVASYQNAALAHNNGREPLFLIPGIATKPAPGSANRPAKVVLRIARKAGTESLSAKMLNNYRLNLSFEAVNTTQVGKTLWRTTNTCYRDTGSFPCDEVPIKITEPLRAALFRPIDVPMPALTPGRSIDVPFLLTPSAYWLPGHKEAIRKAGGHVRYNDWIVLYRGARLSITGGVVCPKTIGSAEYCLSPAGLTYSIPAQGN